MRELVQRGSVTAMLLLALVASLAAQQPWATAAPAPLGLGAPPPSVRTEADLAILLRAQDAVP